jgi:polar amino acid transport system substrate-binding protein
MHIRSNALATAALLLSTAILAGCGNDKAIDTDGISTITPDTLTVCSDIPYAPFELGENSSYTGIDVDVLKAIGSDLDYKVTFQPTAFDDIFTAMHDKKCDVIASAVSINDERKKTMLFSDGYFEINQSMLVRSADAKTFGSLDKLQGHKVGVQNGTTGEEYAKSHTAPATVTGYDGADDMIAALKNKEVDAVVQDYPVNSYTAQQDSDLKVVQTFTDVQREEYGIAMALDAPQLQSAVNASLKNIRSDGRYDSILSKYLGSATSRK